MNISHSPWQYFGPPLNSKIYQLFSLICLQSASLLCEPVAKCRISCGSPKNVLLAENVHQGITTSPCYSWRTISFFDISLMLIIKNLLNSQFSKDFFMKLACTTCPTPTAYRPFKKICPNYYYYALLFAR